MSFRRNLAAIGLAVSVAIGGTHALANQELFTELENAAQSARELALLEPIDVRVVTRDEYRQEQVAEYEEEALLEGADDWNTLLVFLGFIEEGDNMIELFQGFISEQVLGSYDPESKQLIVVSTNTDEWSATDKTTFVHETVHALQDQHFDIMSLYGDTDYVTDDQVYAVRSLVEGDASVAEMIYMIENNLIDQIMAEYENSEMVSTDDVPFFLLETMTFSYDEGSTFVLSIWQDSGWQGVNAVWENPPTTSEQIIHPEKYHQGEGAVPVAIADPQPVFGDDWRVIEDNQWGELGTRVFLENSGASTNRATRAAEGWGGDGVFVITNDQESAMVWTTAWDSEEDAIEFLDTLVDAESTRLGASIDESDDNATLLSADGWYGQIHRDGDVVTYFLTQSEASMDLIIESQVGAEIQDRTAPASEATPATPANTIAFWLRES